VEAIRHFRLLLLCTGFYLSLKDTFVVPSFRPNLVSDSYMDKLGYLCSFGNNVPSLYFNSNVVGTSSLLAHDNLYMFEIVAFYNESLNMESRDTKHKIGNTSS